MQGRILVKVINPEEKTKGGLYLPESAKDRSLIKAEVKALGLQTPDYDCHWISAGSIVLFVEYAASEIPGKPEYRLVRYEDVHAVIEKEEETNNDL